MKLTRKALKRRLAKFSPLKGDAEWVVVYLEKGRVQATSSLSERLARKILSQHPEGRLYFGHVYLIETQ